MIEIKVDDRERPALDAFLSEALYQFNVEATGISDGRYLNASIENAEGETIAGVSGHTWGECCEVLRLWVRADHRGTGLGDALMQAVLDEARARGCRQIVLSTHSFQAPDFYRRLGFVHLASVADYPRGPANMIFVKQLGSATWAPVETQ